MSFMPKIAEKLDKLIESKMMALDHIEAPINLAHKDQPQMPIIIEVERPPTQEQIQRLLDDLYQTLRSQIQSDMSVHDILQCVSIVTRKCLPDDDLEEIQTSDPMLAVFAAIKKRAGGEAHHAWLNRYFINRLIDDKCLLGNSLEFYDLDHSSENAPPKWNQFQDARTDKLYYLDSYRNCVANLHTESELVNKKYQTKIASRMRRVFENTIVSELNAHLHAIKNSIESDVFHVGSFGLFQGGVTVKLQNGSTKRLPHRVAEIYKTLQSLKDNANREELSCLWKEIRQLAIAALDKPRYDQKETTAQFYRNVLMVGKIEELSLLPNPVCNTAL